MSNVVCLDEFRRAKQIREADYWQCFCETDSLHREDEIIPGEDIILNCEKCGGDWAINPSGKLKDFEHGK